MFREYAITLDESGSFAASKSIAVPGETSLSTSRTMFFSGKLGGLSLMSRIDRTICLGRGKVVVRLGR